MTNSPRGLRSLVQPDLSSCITRFALTFVALGFMMLSAQSAVAQDPNADVGFKTVRLSEGFQADPNSTSLEAGGPNEVSKGGCDYGYVANAPDVDLYYTTSTATTLYIYARSSEDTMILVSMPDGSWRCDDDTLGNLDPLLIVRRAPAGLYDIWVGTIGDNRSATLYISEIDPR